MSKPATFFQKNRKFDSFTAPEYQKIIEDEVVSKEFPLLKNSHRKTLSYYLSKLVNEIYIWNYFPSTDDFTSFDYFKNIVSANNNYAIKGLIPLLLPHIESGKELIKEFNDIYQARVNDDFNKDPSKEQIEYLHTNQQYSRCFRTKDNKVSEFYYQSKILDNSYALALQTIKTVSNKLFVNWIETFPYNPEQLLFKEDSDGGSKLLGQTNTRFLIQMQTMYTNNALDASKLDNYIIELANDKRFKPKQGIYIGDIYNTVRNFLYEDINDIYWTIKNYSEDNKIYYYCEIFEEYEVENIYSSFDSKKLEELKANYFNTLNNILENVSDPASRNNTIDDEGIKKYIIILFYITEKVYLPDNEKFKKMKLKLKDLKKEKRINFPFSYVEGNFFIKDNFNLTNDEVKEFLSIVKKIISFKIFYNYLYEVKKIFDTTFYGIVIKITKEKEKENEEDSDNSNSLSPTHFLYDNLEQIFLIIKSIIHYEKEKNNYQIMHKCWDSLPFFHKKAFIIRLNYFHNNYGKTYQSIFPEYLNMIPSTPTQNDGTNIIKSVFYCLCYYGLLSKIEPNMDALEKAPSTKIDRIETTKKFLADEKIDRYNRCYSFLKNDRYDSMEFMVKGKRMKFLKYFRDVSESAWNYLYSLNWVAQINFFHHMIHNRVIFVTGATGVGKSTEMPKILMYGTKMLNYQKKGRVVFTIPRTNAISKGVQYISTEMGVPIFETDADGRKIRTNNYSFQYKYKLKNKSDFGPHTFDNEGVSIKFTTDGMLVNELIENILLKKKIGSSYTSENIYDIVCIDEAHEHNVNMDLILSLMKYTCYYNNRIRLVISSATLKYDEGRLRNFYRCINDNRSYPPSVMLSVAKGKRTEILDRINVDRRMHVSPPGMTTNYKITLIESPTSNAFDITMKILGTTSEGDILVFQPGKKEIISLVEKLNKNTSANIIALPYHSEITSEEKERLDEKNFYKITISKTGKGSVPIGTYTRRIIVATNIAEASITIDTLSYVIDDGLSKVMFYNNKTKNTDLVKNIVSKSSIEQRAGRVGRVAPGTVYRLYKKTDVKDIPDLAITISDISSNLYNIFYTSFGETTLFDKFTDPNSFKNLTDEKNYAKFNYENILKPPKGKKLFVNESVKKMLLDDYFVLVTKQKKNKKGEEEYYLEKVLYRNYGNRSMYDYENDIPPNIYYETGFDIQSIVDKEGKFYSIHPEEGSIRRNITGTIVKEIKEDSRSGFPKMDSFLDILSDKLYLISYFGRNKISTTLKTQFGNEMNKMKQELKVDTPFYHSMAHGYVYSIKLNCSKEYLRVFAMVLTMNAVPLTKNFKMDEYYDSSSSDFSVIYSIGTKIFKMFTSFKIPLKSKEKDLDQEKKIIEMKKKYFKKDNGSIPLELLDKFIILNSTGILKNNDTLSNDERKELINVDTLDISFINLKNNYLVVDWCILNKISIEFVSLFHTNYVAVISQFERNKDIYEACKNMSRMIILNDSGKSVVENIFISIMHAFPAQFVKKLPSFNIFVDINYPATDSLYSIKRIVSKNANGKKKINVNTFLDNTKYGTSYLFYLMKTNNYMSFMSYVTPEFIQKYLSYVYYPSRIQSLKPFEKCQLEEKKRILTKVSKTYCDTIQPIYSDLKKYYNPRIWYNFSKLGIMQKRKKSEKINNVRLYDIIESIVQDNKL